MEQRIVVTHSNAKMALPAIPALTQHQSRTYQGTRRVHSWVFFLRFSIRR